MAENITPIKRWIWCVFVIAVTIGCAKGEEGAKLLEESKSAEASIETVKNTKIIAASIKSLSSTMKTLNAMQMLRLPSILEGSQGTEGGTSGGTSTGIPFGGWLPAPKSSPPVALRLAPISQASQCIDDQDIDGDGSPDTLIFYQSSSTKEVGYTFHSPSYYPASDKTENFISSTTSSSFFIYNGDCAETPSCSDSSYDPDQLCSWTRFGFGTCFLDDANRDGVIDKLFSDFTIEISALFGDEDIGISPNEATVSISVDSMGNAQIDTCFDTSCYSEQGVCPTPLPTSCSLQEMQTFAFGCTFEAIVDGDGVDISYQDEYCYAYFDEIYIDQYYGSVITTISIYSSGEAYKSECSYSDYYSEQYQEYCASFAGTCPFDTASCDAQDIESIVSACQFTQTGYSIYDDSGGVFCDMFDTDGDGELDYSGEVMSWGITSDTDTSVFISSSGYAYKSVCKFVYTNDYYTDFYEECINYEASSCDVPQSCPADPLSVDCDWFRVGKTIFNMDFSCSEIDRDGDGEIDKLIFMFTDAVFFGGELMTIVEPTGEASKWDCYVKSSEEYFGVEAICDVFYGTCQGKISCNMDVSLCSFSSTSSRENVKVICDMSGCNPQIEEERQAENSEGTSTTEWRCQVDECSFASEQEYQDGTTSGISCVQSSDETVMCLYDDADSNTEADSCSVSYGDRITVIVPSDEGGYEYLMGTMESFVVYHCSENSQVDLVQCKIQCEGEEQKQSVEIIELSESATYIQMELELSGEGISGSISIRENKKTGELDFSGTVTQGVNEFAIDGKIIGDKITFEFTVKDSEGIVIATGSFIVNPDGSITGGIVEGDITYYIEVDNEGAGRICDGAEEPKSCEGFDIASI